MTQSTLVEPGSIVNLADLDPDYHSGLTKNDPVTKRKLKQDRQSMAELQERLYAEGRQALLVVLQAMDAGGKDGTIKHVMRGLNPQSCSVASFKVPTDEELSHDFLWRIHKRAPAKGQIAVFNRSHYEDVIAVRVLELVPEEVWRQRYDRINEFEALLVENGTRILKFYLHLSKEEQKERFEARIREPTKHWKFSARDLEQRKLWDDYMRAFEEALSRCSTVAAPWHVIPANRKWYRNLVVADTIRQALEEMAPQWPAPKVDVSSVVIE